MPSYPNQFLMLSDELGTPTELFNGARLARNLQSATLCGTGIFDNILANAGCDGLLYQPTAPAALNDAVLWLDAVDGSPSRQSAPNRGTAGAQLNATLGSTTAAGTDEPLWLGGAEKYLYTPAVAGNNASVPHTASLAISGDIEIIMRVAMDDWTPAIPQVILGKYVSTTAGWDVQVANDGTLAFRARLAASDIGVASTVALPATDGADYRLKVDRVAATGVVRFWYAPGGSNNEPAVWAQLGASVTSTAGNMTVGTQPITIGEGPGPIRPASAKFYRVIVRTTVDASTDANVLDVDFTSVPNTLAAQSGFVATAGGTVTINRTTSGRKSVMYMGRPLWLFGTDDYMTIPDNNLLDFDANESFTVVAVVRQWTTPVNFGAYLSKQTDGSGKGYSLQTSGTSIIAQFAVTDTVSPVGALAGASSSGTLQVIGGVRDQADPVGAIRRTIRSYSQGVSGTAVADATGSVANAAAFRVGALDGSTFHEQDFELMAVLVWRRALTAAEMAAVSAFYQGAPQLSNQCWTPIDLTTDPWDTAAAPESSDAFGFFIEEWTGLDGAHHTRATSPTGQNRGGAYFGPQSHNSRAWKLNVLLHGRSERGLEYLFRWLEAQLLNACNATCGTQFAYIRQVCPSDAVNNPQEGFARAERVVLLDGPTWESPPIDLLACYVRRVSFTLGVGDPCLYREATPVTLIEQTSVGGAIGATNVLSNCATWAASPQRHVQANLPSAAGYGLTAPVVTITSQAQSAGGTRAALPVLRIAGYNDPYGYGDPCRAKLIGEFILEGYETSGMEIVVDMAKRKVRLRTQGSVDWLDGSRLIGRSLRSGLPRWWSFGPCDTGFVVVEPAFTGQETNRVWTVSNQVSNWTVQIQSGVRFGCA